MKRNKAFTLVEMIVVIAIIGILTAIAIPSIKALMDRFRDDYYSKLEESVSISAQSYILDNKTKRPSNNSSIRINASELVDKSYIDQILDYKKESCQNNSYIIVTKKNNKYQYTTCLKCTSDNYNTDNTVCR